MHGTQEFQVKLCIDELQGMRKFNFNKLFACVKEKKKKKNLISAVLWPLEDRLALVKKEKLLFNLAENSMESSSSSSFPSLARNWRGVEAITRTLGGFGGPLRLLFPYTISKEQAKASSASPSFFPA